MLITRVCHRKPLKPWQRALLRSNHFSMQSLLLVLHSWLPRARNPKQKALLKYLQPSYIAVDIGLSSNYHDIIYQAILVQDNFFEDKRRSYRGFSNKGARIAEGDR